MRDLRVVTLTGEETALPAAAVEGFKKSLRGHCIPPGDDGYDGARTIPNGMIDRHPALIARCAGVADVITAVHFGRDQHLPVAVRGGGHGVPGFAVCDSGLMIDLSQMKSIRVAPIGRAALRAASRG